MANADIFKDAAIDEDEHEKYLQDGADDKKCNLTPKGVNLNRASDKDNYLMPSMEHILQIVSGAQMFPLLDGFSGYNQVLVAKLDRLKTTFRTKWGTFAYRRMSFGLVNAGTTFQRAMDIAFRGLIRQSIVVYLDDATVFSRKQGRPHTPSKEKF
eukprot:PITA_21722